MSTAECSVQFDTDAWWGSNSGVDVSAPQMVADWPDTSSMPPVSAASPPTTAFDMLSDEDMLCRPLPVHAAPSDWVAEPPAQRPTEEDPEPLPMSLVAAEASNGTWNKSPAVSSEWSTDTQLQTTPRVTRPLQLLQGPSTVLYQRSTSPGNAHHMASMPADWLAPSRVTQPRSGSPLVAGPGRGLVRDSPVLSQDSPRLAGPRGARPGHHGWTSPSVPCSGPCCPPPDHTRAAPSCGDPCCMDPCCGAGQPSLPCPCDSCLSTVAAGAPRLHVPPPPSCPCCPAPPPSCTGCSDPLCSGSALQIRRTQFLSPQPQTGPLRHSPLTLSLSPSNQLISPRLTPQHHQQRALSQSPLQPRLAQQQRMFSQSPSQLLSSPQPPRTLSQSPSPSLAPARLSPPLPSSSASPLTPRRVMSPVTTPQQQQPLSGLAPSPASIGPMRPLRGRVAPPPAVVSPSPAGAVPSSLSSPRTVTCSPQAPSKCPSPLTSYSSSSASSSPTQSTTSPSSASPPHSKSTDTAGSEQAAAPAPVAATSTAASASSSKMASMLLTPYRPPELTWDLIRRHFHLPLREASIALNVSVLMLKNATRTFGLDRWPHTKLAAVNPNVEDLEALMADPRALRERLFGKRRKSGGGSANKSGEE